MHLLILPFVLAGFTTKIINLRMRNKLQSDNPEKQLDIIIATFFNSIKPTNFEGTIDENSGDKTNQEAKVGNQTEDLS